MKILVVVIVFMFYNINDIEPKRREHGPLNYDDNETTNLSIIGVSQLTSNPLMILLVQPRPRHEVRHDRSRGDRPCPCQENSSKPLQRQGSASSNLIPTRSHMALKEALQSYKKDDKMYYMASDDGILYLVDSSEPIDTIAIANYMSNPNNNEYLLYTRTNPHVPQYLSYGDRQSVSLSNYDPAKLTVFLCHGWQGHGKTHMNQILTKAFLNNSDANVVVLDWSKLAKIIYYPTPRAGTAAVGRLLGQFINWMVENGFTLYHKVHLVGFSLGGHLVGNAGRETGSAVGRITALDPAGPGWKDEEERIVASDGQYVEVIHTNTHFFNAFESMGFGYTEPCGDADFYPNGGAMMPGCWLNICSHGRAYEYMASSVIHNHFMAYGCQNNNEMVQDKCSGPVNFMGNSDLFKPLRGIFRVNTGKHYPF